MCILQNGRGSVEPISERSKPHSAATAAMTSTADRPSRERRRRLTPAAIAISSEKVGRAYSPIVVAGMVRVIDFAMLSAVGTALYFGYVVPLSGFSWAFLAAIVGVSVTAVICFQAADIYQVQVFRGNLRQMTRMISSWASCSCCSSAPPLPSNSATKFRDCGLRHSSSAALLRW